MFQIKLVVLAVVSFVLSFVGSVSAQFQPLEIEWDRKIEWKKGISRSMIQTPDGGYIIGGDTPSYIEGREDFDIVLIKLDSLGNLDTLWGNRWPDNPKTFGGDRNDLFGAFCKTSDGGYIVSGASNSYGDKQVILLLKLNSNGDFDPSWGNNWPDNPKIYELIGPAMATSIQKTSDEGYVMVGNEYNNKKCILLKLNSGGDLDPSWFQNPVRFDREIDSEYQNSVSVRQGADGGFIVAGNASVKYKIYDCTYAYIISFDRYGNKIKRWEYGGCLESYTYTRVNFMSSGGVLAGSTDYYDRSPSTQERAMIIIGGVPLTYGPQQNWDCSAVSIQQTSDGGYIAAGHIEWNSSYDVMFIKVNRGKIIRVKNFVKDGDQFATSIVQTNGGSYLVLYSDTTSSNIMKVTPFNDCNGNREEDLADITSGTSKDCNTNIIPDECDIASGTSQDSNINGLPDECEPPNQPPQITHTPITVAKKGQNLWFEFDVTDEKNQVASITLWVKLSTLNEYISFPFIVHNDSPHYVIDLTGLTDTLAGVDYYIEAKDTEGATKTTPVYHICITEQEKIPIIILPGAMGTELLDAETNELIWLDPANTEWANLLDKDPWLLRLMLKSDGISVDPTTYCSNYVTQKCTSSWNCEFFADCIGGRQMVVGNAVNIEPTGGLGKPGYTAYKKLGEFLEDKGYKLGENYFVFAYDWRLDVESLAQAFNALIKGDGIHSPGIAKNSCDRVQIIAHSLGGLVVRSYLEQNPMDNRIDKAVYIGTPHFGSPKMFAILNKYNLVVDLLGGIIRGAPINTQTVSFVCQNFPSIYQLLPRFDFFKGEKFMDSFKRLKNSNTKLLEKANSFYEKIGASHPSVKQYQISGSGQLTLGEFEVRKDGCIIPIAKNGDGTVSQKGSEDVEGVKYFYVNEEHGALPGNVAVQTKVWQIFNNNEDAKVDLDNDGTEEVKSTPFPMVGSWDYNKCSPIKLEITDSQGNLNSGDDEGNVHEEIPNSLYLKIDHEEAGFLPLNDEYHVKIQAQESGTFTLTLEARDEDGEIIKTIQYLDVPVTQQSNGDLVLLPDGTDPVLEFDANGDGNSDFHLLPGNPPEDLEESMIEQGDVNSDQEVDISDAIAILSYLFLGGKISCVSSGDVNGDKAMDISDSVYILSFLFLGGKEIPYNLHYCPRQ